ncbi:erythromycin esterase family protein [Nocardia transvalensis]|uniref:erythromycin esterase family protein n=1 Tax=Nocardia transvalensis TaxID=37333 RepID=UPI00189494D7|nr:erythromycin esterase family protein [Nocardia transvalensis]MBF6331315.1 erythromycin esterase family protein [Nocardia transvalensis]
MRTVLPTALPLADAETIRDGLGRFLGGLAHTPALLAVGEPTHEVDAFPQLCNDVFACLVEHFGYRAIALESDGLAAELVDAYVNGADADPDEVLRLGFSHGFGARPSTRTLVQWVRAHNETVPPHDRVRVYGFDAPLEMYYAPSPRATLTAVLDYLTTHLGDSVPLPSQAQIDELIGREADWTDQAALFDGSRSIGDSARARALRVLADDLVAALTRETPTLAAASGAEGLRLARRQARTAVGLLRYHALMASTRPDRVAHMLGTRDAMMADNLLDIVEAERHRGPALVWAQNAHLQRHRSAWTLAGMDLRWWSAGALVSTTLGPRYAFIATDHAVEAHQPGTLQHLLAEATSGRALFPTRDLLNSAAPSTTAATTEDPGYFPLNPSHLKQMDAIAFLGGTETGAPGGSGHKPAETT